MSEHRNLEGSDEIDREEITLSDELTSGEENESSVSYDSAIMTPAYYIKQAEKALEKLKIIVKESGWKKAISVKNTTVYSKTGIGENDKVPIFMSEHIIENFTPQSVFAVIGMRKLWDPWYEDGNLVENLDDTTSLTYMVMQAVAGTKTRDLSLVEKIQCDEDGTIFFACTSVETNKVPKVVDRVRARLHLNGWIVKPISYDPIRTKLIYVLQTKVNGWIPSVVAKKYLNKRPLVVYTIDQYLQKNGAPPMIVGSSQTPSPPSRSTSNASIYNSSNADLSESQQNRTVHVYDKKVSQRNLPTPLTEQENKKFNSTPPESPKKLMNPNNVPVQELSGNIAKDHEDEESKGSLETSKRSPLKSSEIKESNVVPPNESLPIQNSTREIKEIPVDLNNDEHNISSPSQPSSYQDDTLEAHGQQSSSQTLTSPKQNKPPPTLPTSPISSTFPISPISPTFPAPPALPTFPTPVQESTSVQKPPVQPILPTNTFRIPSYIQESLPPPPPHLKKYRYTDDVNRAVEVFKDNAKDLKGWNFYADNKGVKVYTKDITGRSTPMIRGDYTLSGGYTADDFLSVIKNMSLRKLWDDRYEDGEYIEFFDNDNTLSRFSVKGTFPISGRDFALRGTVTRDSETQKIYFVTTSITDPAIPEVKKFVRGYVNFTGWQIVSKFDTDGNTKALDIIYIVDTDIKLESVPYSILKSISTGTPIVLQKIDEMLERIGFPPYILKSSSLIVSETVDPKSFQYNLTLSSENSSITEIRYSKKMYPNGFDISIIPKNSKVELLQNNSEILRITLPSEIFTTDKIYIKITKYTSSGFKLTFNGDNQIPLDNNDKKKQKNIEPIITENISTVAKYSSVRVEHPIETKADTENVKPVELHIETEAKAENINPVELSTETKTENVNSVELPTEAETEKVNPVERPTEAETEKVNPVELPTEAETEKVNPVELPTEAETEKVNPVELLTEAETEKVNPVELPIETETETVEQSQGSSQQTESMSTNSTLVSNDVADTSINNINNGKKTPSKQKRLSFANTASIINPETFFNTEKEANISEIEVMPNDEEYDEIEEYARIVKNNPAWEPEETIESHNAYDFSKDIIYVSDEVKFNTYQAGIMFSAMMIAYYAGRFSCYFP